MGHHLGSKSSIVPLIDRLNRFSVGLVDNEKLREILALLFEENEAFEEGILLDVNEAFERLSGYTSEEVIGRSTIELGVWSDPQERREMVTLLERERKVCDWELMLRHKGVNSGRSSSPASLLIFTARSGSSVW